jgi:plasmid stabilization system protein ParE
VQVYFTPSARESLRDISQYIRRISPDAERRTRERIIRRARQLAEFPDSGRMVPEYEVPAVREIIEGSYRIWYRVRDDRVDVLAILHGARQVLDD